MVKGFVLAVLAAMVAFGSLTASYAAIGGYHNQSPIIFHFPSPIVGNDGEGTTFVYPDAINLDNYVTDDMTYPASVIWSYFEYSNTYQLNGVASLDLTKDDPTSAANGAKRINGSTLDPADVDGLSSTITIRNAALSPITGSARRIPGTNNAANVIPGETKIITLFASDGTTYSMYDIIFYTDNGGNDRLSPGGNGPTDTPLDLDKFNYSYMSGTVTSSTANSSALCLQTVAGGDNIGYWHSPYGSIPLVDNAVYHIRMHVNSTQTVANTVPLWDLVIINSDEAGSKGKNLYGGDFIFFDNVGGANAALASGGRNDFDVWWCPAAIKQEKFRSTATGTFSTTFALDKDARVQFRVLDCAGNPAVHAEQALGSVCLDRIEIERFDLSQMQVETANLLNMTSITDADSGGNSHGDDGGNPLEDSAGNTHVEKLNLSTFVIFSNGTVTIRPDVTSEYATIVPGDRTIDLAQGSTLSDNWPVPIETDGLYQVVYGLSAPTVNDVTNSPDVLWLGGDVPSMEVIQTSFVTNWLDSAAMPQVGPPQEYIAFYAANAVSKDPTAAFKFMRPRLSVGNNEKLKVGNNTGAITVHSVKVNKVKFGVG